MKLHCIPEKTYTVKSRIMYRGAIIKKKKKKVLKTRDDITLKILGGCNSKTLCSAPVHHTRLYGICLFDYNIHSQNKCPEFLLFLARKKTMSYSRLFRTIGSISRYNKTEHLKAVLRQKIIRNNNIRFQK